jgi:hypothetical protein
VLSRRRIKVGIAIVGSCLLAYLLIPVIVESRMRHALVNRGFPEAELDVASVGLGHVDLRNIHLEDGADIGALDIGSGISLLWKHVGAVDVRDANVSVGALSRIAAKLHTENASPMSIDRVSVENSTLTVGKTPTRINGSAVKKGNALDVTITVSDPSEHGWTIDARGRLVLGKQIQLQGAHVDVDVPRREVDGVVVTKGKLSADLSGNLSTLELQGRGVARGNVATHGFAVVGATLPFTYDREGLHVGASRATVSGGEVTVDPFVLGTKPTDIVLHAKGVQLGDLLEKTGRVSGKGLVDGSVALHLAGSDWTLKTAALSARSGGTLQVTDQGLRDRFAKVASPLAVHAAIANALTDFQFTELVAELGPRGADPELRLKTRGRGRRNHQELDIAVGVRGVRDVAPSLLGGNQ